MVSADLSATEIDVCFHFSILSMDAQAGPSEIPPAGANTMAFKLHVLSPSAGMPDRLTFERINGSMTVSELKTKIHDVADTHPRPSRQRLIYRGRPLVRDDMTMKEVFGSEAVRSNRAQIQKGRQANLDSDY